MTAVNEFEEKVGCIQHMVQLWIENTLSGGTEEVWEGSGVIDWDTQSIVSRE